MCKAFTLSKTPPPLPLASPGDTGRGARRTAVVNRETKGTQGKSREVILAAGPHPKFIDCIITLFHSFITVAQN